MPELRTGVAAIKNYMKSDPLTNVPYLLIDPSCVNLIRASERRAVDQVTQKPKDAEWKNFADILRYACAAGLQCEPKDRSDWNRDQPGMPSW